MYLDSEDATRLRQDSSIPQRTAASRIRILFLLLTLIAAGTTPSVKAASSFTRIVIDADQAPLAKNLGDLDGDGNLDAIIAGGSNLGTSVYWYHYPSWSKHLIGSIGGGDDLQIKDVNGDGAADIVVSEGIYWYENPIPAGGNIFAQWPVHSIDSGMVAHDLVAIDINGDARPDIVARGEFGATFVYLQNSPVSWTKVALPQSSSGLGTTVADIDRDGRPDIVQNGFWLKQPLDPVGGSWARHDFSAWPDGSTVSAADINKDGRVDVVLGPLEHDQTPLGLGFLTWFEAPADPLSGSWIPHGIGGAQEVHRLHLADIDHNGELDVVFAEMHESETHRVGVYFNGGRGNSWTLQILSTEGSHNIAVGDIGSDGDIDVLGANWSPDAPDGGALNLWLNNASSVNSFALDDWTYVEADNTRTGASTGLAFADLSGDGLADIIAGPYWYRNPGGNLTGPWTRTDLGGFDAMLALDVDGNGRLDLIGEASGGNDVGVYWLAPANAGATQWSATLIGAVPSGSDGGLSRGYHLAQIVPGGKPEIVLTSGSSAYYFQIPPNPDAANWPRTEISSEVQDSGIDVADIDGDGDPDLAGFVRPGGVGVAWWENPGTGAASWLRHDIGITTGIEGGRLAISEINGDGRKDVVVTEANLGGSGNSLIWFERPLNSVATNWTRRIIALDQGSLDSMDAADMDHDGTTEVITGESQGTRRVIIWKTSDAGTNWFPHVVSTGLGNYLGTKLWDLDGDGDLDVVGTASDAPQYLHIWRNNASENGPVSIAVANAQTTGLTAGYAFDEVSGTTAPDASGHGIFGTLVNGSSWTPGFHGNALMFDGVDDYVDLGNPTSLRITGSLTLSGWINASAFPVDDAVVVSKRTGGASGFQLDLTKDTGDRTIGFKLTSATGESMFRFGATILEVNTWYHIAGVYDAATRNMHVYLNGQPDDGALVGTVTDSQQDSTENVTIGRRAGVSGFEFAGRIDDVRIYDRALTVTEIQTDMVTPVGTIGSTDPNPPEVHLEAPVDGALVGDIIVIEAQATDDIALFGVQFFVDGVPTGLLDTEAPYALTWDTRTATNGAHTLTAKAYDTGANSAVSPPVSVNVSNTSFFRNEILATGLDLPTAIKFLPDGRLLVVELAGTIKVLPAPYTEPDPTPFLQLTNVGSAGVQQGVYELALDPDFSTNHYYYIFYTHATPNRDRLSRFTANATLTGTIAGSELVLYQDPEDVIGDHHGGAITFDNDGKIYFTTGEQFDAADSQLLSSPRGKLHRINRDGTVPTDNPYYDGTGPNWDSIWAIGLRNPFRAYYDAPTDRLLIADVGGNDYSTAQEEVHVGARGANYGWPNVEGISGNPAYTNPIYTYPHNGRDASITGGFVYRGTGFPSSYQGSYFFADYTQNWIRRLTFDASGNVTGVFNFEPADGSADGPYGDIVYLTEGPDGALYYVDLGFSDIGGTFGVSKIRRIQYIQSDLPPVVTASATPTNGAAPLAVAFSSAGSSDPEGLPLTYLWNFGDGQTSTDPNPQHTYLGAGLYQARLSVSDGVNTTLSLPISIRAGNAPVATLLTAPANGGVFRAGDIISYSAQATDVEDGSLPSSAFTWNIDFLHEGHVHPGIAISGVTGGSFAIPTSGHDFSGFTRYRITLTVTDSDGLQSSQTSFVFPDKVNLTFDSVPSGLTLKFDGISFATPFVRDDVIGFQHLIEAPDQVVGSNTYVFSSWSDGGAQVHSVVTPATNQLNTASFNLVVPDNSPPVMSNVAASAITATGATIQWITNEASDTQVEYGITIGYGQTTALSTALVSMHAAALTGLTENTTYHYRVLSRDAAGNLATSGDFTFTTIDSPLTVEEFVPSSSGFTIQFSRPLDPAELNLFDTETGGLGPPDLTVIGSTHGLIKGSMLINSLAGRVAFIRTGTIFLPDTYTVTLRSAADGFRDLQGGLLDGNRDGIRGDGFATTFTVLENSFPVLSIGDFTRGAGQPVNIGPSQQGIPVTLSNGANVQSVALSVGYDPDLLVVAAVVPGGSLPVGSQVQTDLSNPGQVHVTVSSAIPFGAGAIELVRLIAQVPDSAPYRARQILHIENVSVNDGALAVAADDALHVGAYLGDTTGNGTYSSLDAQRVLRIATGLDSGFTPFITTDAVNIADVSGNGAISSLDATRILQAVAGLGTGGIPPLPEIPVPAVSPPGGDSF